MPSLSDLRRSPAMPALVALFAGIAFFSADPGGVVESGRHAAFDRFQRSAPRPYVESAVRVIDIDDASLARVGQWPWSRLQVARLVHRLANAGAAVIALDIIFAESDRTAPASMLAVWDATLDLPDDLRTRLVSDLPDPDRLLAGTIGAAGSVVTAFGPRYDGESGPAPALKASFATAGDDPLEHALDFGPSVNSLPALEAAAAGNGSVAFGADTDLTVRRLPLLTAYEGQLRPSLTVEALRVAADTGTIIVKSTGASGEDALGQGAGIVSLKVGPFEIPTDATGAMHLYYSAPTDDRRLSAWKVLDDAFDPADVEGRIVFVGTSAAGLRDLRPSPLDPVMPGVEAHAQAVEQILSGTFLQRPDWAAGLEWIVAIFAGLLIVFVVGRLGPRGALIVFAALVAAIVVGAWLAWSRLGLLLDPVLPVAIGALVFANGLAGGYLFTDTDRRRVSRAFAHYLSPHLVTELARHPERLKLGGETREMSILFCDIRGFTRVSESLKDDPQALTRLINRFLTPLTEQILRHGGTIDKYMGDCIMAFWNAPIAQPDHAERACAAALDMLRALAVLNAELAAEAAAEGRPAVPLAVGIGINSGRCVVGNMGSNQRFDYSVLGDAVNLAARLEGQSKTYGVEIVIGERTHALAAGHPALELDLIAVKGKAEAVRIFTLLPPDETGGAALSEAHAELLDAYRSAEPDRAEAALERARTCAPAGLERLYAVYAERIAAHRADPPPDDWDGVYVARTK